MSELKYSGLTVGAVMGLVASLLFENLLLVFAGIIAGILYEVVIEKKET